jgi:hypothetical protein
MKSNGSTILSVPVSSASREIEGVTHASTRRCLAQQALQPADPTGLRYQIVCRVIANQPLKVSAQVRWADGVDFRHNL